MGISLSEFELLRARCEANSGRVSEKSERRSEKPKTQRRGVPNKWEQKYRDEVLEPRRLAGEILWYDFEPIRFRLADGAYYCPDFMARENTGAILVIEIKGFWRAAARIRIKVAADKYGRPGTGFFFVAVTRDKVTGEWVTEHFPKGWV